MDEISLQEEMLVSVQFLELLVTAVEGLVDSHLFLVFDQTT